MKKLLSEANRSIRSFFLKEEKDNYYNYFALALAAGLGHIIFGFYWTYIAPQTYEGYYLRGVGLLICFILLVLAQKDQNSKLIYYFWLFALAYNLPFFFTVNLIMNNFSDIWFVGEATMIAVTILFLTNILDSFLIMAAGILAAILFCLVKNPELVYFNQQITRHLPIYSLTFGASYIFGYSNRKGFAVSKEVKYQREKKLLTSFAGSIAHELRNPLNVINISASQLNAISNQVNNLDLKKNIAEINRIISSSVSQANNAINLILSDIKDRVISPNDFSLFKPSSIIPEIVNNFFYTSSEQKLKIKLKIDPDSDFIFRASEDRLTFIFYNLLKNAIYYLRDYPKSEIIIGNELRILEDKEWIAIYVYDTGPGIPPEIMPRLFDDFFSFGKRDGTGLGLSFCRRNMQNFSGKIICESEYNNEDRSNPSWTKFSLLFPKLTQKEIDNLTEIIRKKSLKEREIRFSKLGDPKDYYSITNNKTILYADDEEINLMIVKRKLEPLGFKITGVNDGDKLLKSYLGSIDKKYHYSNFDLIITDINMPFYSGIEVAEKIRQFEKEDRINKSIPIIALSGNGDNEDIDKFYKAGINDFFIKGSDPELLVKVVVNSILDVTHGQM